MNRESQLCTFHLGDQLFGIPVGEVQEVLRRQPATHVPLTHPTVAGLLNLRGQIVTLLDLRRRLALPDPEAGTEPPGAVIIIRVRNELLGLLVDRRGHVVEVDPDLFAPPPSTLQGPARDYITGAYRLPDRLLLRLDVDRTAEVST